jgi:hypothetical protein
MNRIPPILLGALAVHGIACLACCGDAPGHNIGFGGGGSATTSSESATGASTSSASATSSSGAAVPVACDDGPCALGQVCCFNRFSSTPPDACGAPGQCGAARVELSCSDPAACPGAVCCMAVDPNDHQDPYLGSACAATCADQGGTKVVVCSDAQPGVCPAGTTCQASSILPPGYRVCE